ncbi:phage baseplate assembly protein V [Mesorhizobium sp. IMUNJ 23232]|uniref:phage baseplate assembly protein V n=1 Tax=Mesorhizobium sp. IMUNJ 23232 TaxID=3376064 RepID=UPI00379BDD53
MLDDQMERLFEALASRHFGKYPGVVKDNVDPLKSGRVEVEIPTVLGAQRVWALPCVPYVGKGGLGFHAIPDTGCNVWIEFIAGDRNHPIWTGCFWPENALDTADAMPGVKFWKTTSFTIRIDDDQGELTIESAAGGKITISPTEISIEAPSINQTCGSRKVALTPATFDVFSGAFSVV